MSRTRMSLAFIEHSTAGLRWLDERIGARVGERDRGDVPGWVLITLMTAGLVTALWAVAGPQLTKIFTDAISSVSGPK